MSISGAGTKLTKTVESAQCLFCAARFHVVGKDLTTANISKDILKTALTYTDTDEIRLIQKCYDDLDDAWWDSLTYTANFLYKKYGSGSKSKRYTFHRGSTWVGEYEEQYGVWNKEAGRYFSNINKYNPSDIWMVAKSDENNKPFSSVMNFGQANKFLTNKYKSKEIIGVSLKKTDSPQLSEFNLPGASKYDIKYMSSTLSNTSDFFASKDVYVHYNTGKIQFRSFSSRPTGWQGEIKGSNANLGKIGGGTVNGIISNTFPNKNKAIFQITSSGIIADEVKSVKNMSESFLNGFYSYYTSLTKGKKMSKNEMIIGLRKKQGTWIYSKYLGMELLALFSDLSSQERNTLMSNLILYAMSASPISAPFIKIS